MIYNCDAYSKNVRMFYCSSVSIFVISIKYIDKVSPTPFIMRRHNKKNYLANNTMKN